MLLGVLTLLPRISILGCWIIFVWIKNVWMVIYSLANCGGLRFNEGDVEFHLDHYIHWLGIS